MRDQQDPFGRSGNRNWLVPVPAGEGPSYIELGLTDQKGEAAGRASQSRCQWKNLIEALDSSKGHQVAACRGKVLGAIGEHFDA